MNPQAEMLDFSQVEDEDLAAKGREAYRNLYLNKGKVGVHLSHDQEDVVFHEDRFDHAFYAKRDKWSLAKDRSMPDESRLERMPWIGPLIAGAIEGSEAWEVPSPTGRRRPPNRLYILWDEKYVVWLEPRCEGGWKFSSAYVKTRGQIRDHCRGGTKIWEKRKVPRD